MIELTGLRFAYTAGEPLFTGLDVSFEPSQMTAVTGPSGSGKSTLLYLLGLLLRPQGGQVVVNGRDTAQMPDAERSWLRAHAMGFVFQDAALDASRTVLDNVTESALYTGMRRRVARHRAHELLARFGVELRAGHRPGQVSGGQAQRVALCRALLNDPRVVLADEPTGNLDQAAADDVLVALREVAADGATVLVATHDPRVVERCDAVVAL
ncbi:MAG: ABC transporter ATP-binding protein [Jiangellaceae bacterium]